MTVRPGQRLFHFVLESHAGRALVPILERGKRPWETSTPRRRVVLKRLASVGRLEKRTSMGRLQTAGSDAIDPEETSIKRCSEGPGSFETSGDWATYRSRALAAGVCFRVAVLTFDGCVIGKTSRMYSAS